MTLELWAARLGLCTFFQQMWAKSILPAPRLQILTSACHPVPVMPSSCPHHLSKAPDARHLFSWIVLMGCLGTPLV